MCGIFGYIGNKNNAPSVVFDGLKELEYRGYDSWGVASVSNNKTIRIQKRVGKIGTASLSDLGNSSLSIGHTRWATHGGVTKNNAHPHTSDDKTVAIVHNGIIENYIDLIADLKKKGYTLKTDTDSELTAHYIHYYKKRYGFVESVRKTFNLLDGLNALIAIDTTSNNIVAVKNGSPLVVGHDDSQQFISSDPSVIGNKTSRVYFLQDSDMVVLSRKNIQLYDVINGKQKDITYKKLSVKRKRSNKGAYAHYLIKEIHEQPRIIDQIADNDIQQAKSMAKHIKNAYGTYLIGCGTASYACASGSYIFSEVAKRHVNACVASEFGYQLDFLTNKSLVIALSQSGETADLIEAMKKASDKKAMLGGLVNVEESTIYRMTSLSYSLNAGIEKSVASSKAFSAMIAHLVLAAYSCSGDTTTGVRVIKNASKAAKALLAPAQKKRIQTLAKKIAKKRDIFIVGRGLSYPASLEAALKIKEISYIHAEGFAAGELKHGVLALVEKGTPCIVYAPSDNSFHENIAGAMEMKARGGYIIGVAEKPHETFDFHIPIKQAGVATIIPNVVFAQLLAYYLTLERGLDPDMPRNLAKSVTVK